MVNVFKLHIWYCSHLGWPTGHLFPPSCAWGPHGCECYFENQAFNLFFDKMALVSFLTSSLSPPHRTSSILEKVTMNSLLFFIVQQRSYRAVWRRTGFALLKGMESIPCCCRGKLKRAFRGGFFSVAVVVWSWVYTASPCPSHHMFRHGGLLSCWIRRVLMILSRW